MKKYFYIAMTMVIILSLTIIGYGIFVNYKGESIILERMNNRSIMVNATTVKMRQINARYEFPEASMYSRQSVDVIAKVDGVITRKFIHKNKHVQAGDVIVELTNEDLPLKIKQAESALRRAEAVELQAKNSYSRYSSLIEQNATSLEKLDEARANYAAAQADVANARAQYEQAVLNQDRLRVVSNSDGYVLVSYKEEGNFVTAGTPICLIGDFKFLWFALSMEDAALRSLLGEAGEQGQFTLSFKRPDFVKAYNTEYSSGNRGNKSVFPVDIYGIYPALSEPAAMRRVVFNLYNDAGILEARSYEDMVLTANQPRYVLAVPLEALENNYNTGNVYVINSNQELEERYVSVGAIGEKYAEILSGLQEGDVVVVSGIEGLKAGQKVEANLEEGEE
ncbi:MAG: efflux RND transporter periplasmic adaptor subunit [Selenomonadaceae bacterium]|nr:efflux RND transporter periplasmic adaptor subunit [Selenomonadaceae bacterium]